MRSSVNALLRQSYDCLILVHPQIQALKKVIEEAQELGFASLNLSKGLSTSLLSVSALARSRFAHQWLMDTLASFQRAPVICAYPDLLFDPSLQIDPLALFRHAARFIQIIVMWPGEYSANTLSYAVPEHHHFRTWKISDSLLRQPAVIIQRISTSQGA